MIDEVHFAEHVVLAAVGIERNGTKLPKSVPSIEHSAFERSAYYAKLLY